MKHTLTIISRVCHCEADRHRLKQSLFLITIIAGLLFLPPLGFAQSKEIISEGTYNMGDGETPSVAESRALLQAKRTALEQAGTYVESYSKVINLKLSEDEIQVLASGLMEVEILDKKRTVVGEGIHFYVKIKTRVNLDKTEELANRIKTKDKSFIEDYKKIQGAYDKSQKEIEELKKQLVEAKSEKERKQLEAKITDKERLFQANEWFEKGYYFFRSGEYQESISAFNWSIELNPNNLAAYNIRGFLLGLDKHYEEALRDFEKAIELNPKNPETYVKRGDLYKMLRKYHEAIINYNEAIEINPSYADAFLMRSGAYEMLGNRQQAFKDGERAIELDPLLSITTLRVSAIAGNKFAQDILKSKGIKW